MLEKPPKDSGGWSKYELYVVNKLRRLEELQEKQAEAILKLHTELAVLNTKFKIKSGIWGLVGGFVPIVVLIALYFLNSP